MNLSKELFAASDIAVSQCMNLKQSESVLIITDEFSRTIAYALYESSKKITEKILLVEIPQMKTNGEEPPKEVSELMLKYDVIFCPTSKSLTHTDARRNASQNGSRVATLPGVTEEIMIRCMNADYNRIYERTFKLCKLMEQTSSIRVTSKLGTDITMPIYGRKSFASSGIFHNKGESGNLPTGEAYLAPLENISNGKIVVDGSIAQIGLIKSPITIKVENGFATEIIGDEEAKKFISLIEPFGLPAKNVAEFGIGTNDKAIITGKIIEDEKSMGTIHIAFGDNKSMGGSVRVASHLDVLVKNPTVYFDKNIIMENGNFLIEL